MVPATSKLTERTVGLGNLLRQGLADITDAHIAVTSLVRLALTKGHQENSIGKLLEKHAASHPQTDAIRYENTVISYGVLNQRANQAAHYFQSQGIKSGDVIAVMLENRPECIINVLGIVKLGAVAAMINTSQTGEVLLHSLTLVKPSMLLVGEELVDHYNTVKADLSPELNSKVHYIADIGSLDCPDNMIDLADVTANQPDGNLPVTQTVKLHQPCYYIFTSGTTGLPKASVMSHLRFMKSMLGMGLASMRLRRTDVLYVSLPLYHNNALTVSLAGVLGAGACIAIARKFSVSRFWDDIRHYKATGFCYIGELCRYLLNSPATNQDQNHNIRVIVGNGLRADIWMEFKQRFNIPRISEFYGASECNLVFTNSFNMDKTCGFCPLSYNIVRYDIEEDCAVLDSNGFMIPVGKGEVGLLITEVNDKQPFDGYTDSEASNKKLFRSVFEQDDCWFNTGDLVLNQGFKHVAFADRLGDTFRWKGENVATTEVESVMMEHKFIEHAVVYGVEIPHTDGRAGMATVTTTHKLSDEEWADFTGFLRNKLPAYSIPVFLRLREQQEVTGTFKYRKVELKEEAYHLAKVDEPVYVLADKQSPYSPLTPEVEAKINAGEISL